MIETGRDVAGAWYYASVNVWSDDEIEAVLNYNPSGPANLATRFECGAPTLFECYQNVRDRAKNKGVPAPDRQVVEELYVVLTLDWQAGRNSLSD
jgi:hypothetical protein